MAAVVGDGVALGNAIGAVTAATAPVTAATAVIGITYMGGYELPYGIYVDNLKQSLIVNYPQPREQPVRGKKAELEAAEPGATAAAPGADPVSIEIKRIKLFLNESGSNRKPAAWYNSKSRDSNAMNTLINKGVNDDPGIRAAASAVPFDVNAYRTSMIAFLNANAPTGFNFASVGP